MKRHPHILPRLCALFTLLFAAFRLTAAPVMPTTSTDDTTDEHWYYVSFYATGNLLGNAEIADGNLAIVAAEVSTANQWKIVEDKVVGDVTYYKLKNRDSGLYLGYVGAPTHRYQSVESSSPNLVTFQLQPQENSYRLQRKDESTMSLYASGGSASVGAALTDNANGHELVFLPTLPASDFKYVLFAGYGKFGLHANAASSTLEVTAVTGSEAANEGYKWGTVATAEGGKIYKSDNGYYLKLDGTTGWTVTTNEAEATVLTQSQSTYNIAKTRYNLSTADGKALCYNGTNLLQGNADTRYATLNLTTTVTGPAVSPLPGHWYTVNLVNKNNILSDAVTNGGLDNPELQVTKTTEANSANVWKIIETDKGLIKLQNKNGFYLFNRTVDPAGLPMSNGGRMYLTDNATLATAFYLEDYDTQYWKLRDPTSNNNNYRYVSYNQPADGSQRIRHWEPSDNNTNFGFTPISDEMMADLPTAGVTTEDSYTYLQFSGYGRQLLTDNGAGNALSVTTATEEQPSGDALKWKRSHNNTGEYIFKSKLGNYLDLTNLVAATDIANATPLSRTTNTYSQAVTRYNLVNAGGQALCYNGTTLSAGAPHTRYSLINFATTLNCPDVAPLPDQKYVVNFPAVSKILGGDGLDSPELRKNETDTKNATNIWSIVEDDATGRFRLKNGNGFYLYNRQYEPGTNTECGNGGRFYLTDNLHVATLFYLEEHTAQTSCWQLRDSNPIGTSVYYYLGPGDGADNNLRHQGVNVESNRVSFTLYTEAVTPQAADPYLYLQFTGYGRQVLTDNGVGNALSVTAATEAKPSGDALKWKRSHNDTGQYIFQSKLGNYLNATAATPTTTTDIANATPLEQTANNYFKNESSLSRYNLQTADGQALSFNGNTNTVLLGNLHTRYSCMNLTTSLTGPLSGPVTGKWYTVKLLNKSNILSDDVASGGLDNPELQVANTTEPNSANVWQIIETVEGKIKLQNKNGYYLRNRTEDPAGVAMGNGGRMYLTDNATLATAFYLEDHSNNNNWQLRDASSNDNAHLYVSYNQPADGAKRIRHWSRGDDNTQILFEEIADISAVPAAGIVPANDYVYLQFSCFGRQIIQDAGAGKTLQVVKTNEDKPAADGLQWLRGHNDSGQLVLKSKLGNYLDATNLTTTTTATVQPLTDNSYNGSVSPRYNLTTTDSKALYFDGTTLSSEGTPNTRFTVIRLCNTVTGPDDYPLISSEVESDEHWYRIEMAYLNKALEAKLTGTAIQFTTDYTTLSHNTWKLVDDGSGNGRYYLQNANGLYLHNDPTSGASGQGGRYIATGNKSEATSLRIVEYSEGANRSFWQLRNPNATDQQYLNPYSSTYLEHWSANDAANKVRFTAVAKPATVSEATVYLHYAAMGQVGVYDAGTGLVPTGKKPDYTTDVTEGYLWTVCNKESGVILKSQRGNFLTYSTGSGFGTSTEEDDAFEFKIAANTYENNGNQRSQLLNPADETQALCADYNDHHLYWGVPNTRYSVLWLGSPHIWCTDLPKTSNSLSGFTLYHIRFRSNGYIISSPNVGNATPIPHDDNMQDMSNAWALYRYRNADGTYSGDVFLSNGKGHFLKYDADLSSFTTVATATLGDIPADATKFRLVENDARRDCWQLQLPDHGNKMLKLLSTTSEGTTNYSFTLADRNDAGNYVYFEELNLYPDFCTETTGAWQFIHLDQLTGSPRMEASEDGAAANGSTVTASTSTPDARKTVWKVMGSADDFILKSGTDTYLKVDDRGNVTLTNNKAEAASLALHFNYFAIDKTTIDWIVEVNGTSPTRYLKYEYDSETGTGQFTTAAWPASREESTYYALSFGAATTPKFSDTTSETYYYINFNQYSDPNNAAVNGKLYMSDGVEKTSDAYAELKQVVHSMQWMFVGDKDEVRLKNRNDYYICWDEASVTFGVTADSTKAAVFNMKLAGRTANGTPYGHFLLIGGEGVRNSRLNQYMTITKVGTLYHLTLTTDGIAPDAGQTIVEQVVETKAEDYTQYYIRPKRSWFIKELNDDKVETFAGFIKEDPLGTYGFENNPYQPSIKQQKTNEYKVIRYLKQGTTRAFDTPTYMRSNSSGESKVKAYQRYYNYQTGGRVDPDRINLTEPGRRDYANGTVMGSLLLLNNETTGYAKTSTISFNMPKDAPEDYNYILAVDVSQYTDFIDYFGDNGNEKYNDVICREVNVPEHQDLIEPTLSERYVYDVRNAHLMAKQLTACTEGSDKWLEEYVITYPSKKRGFSVSTVPLGNELQNYWFYRNGTLSEENLQNITSYDNIYFKFENNTAGISGFDVTDWPVEGATTSSADLSKLRFVRFYYPGESSDNLGYGEVPSGSSATILCYARDGGTAGKEGGTLYQLAKITLLFEDHCEPLPYTKVIGRTADGKFKTGRAPEYLRELTGEPVASIDYNAVDFRTFRTPPVGSTSTGFSADQELANTYRYPMLYENSGYNFYPVSGNTYPSTGDLKENSFGSYAIARRLQVSWGFGNFKPVSHVYKLLYNEYTEAQRQAWGIDLAALNNIDSHAFLYLDASDLPGQIASLHFDSNLCSGSRIYASAWMSSPNGWNNSVPATVQFKVVGHTSDNAATDHPVLLHTYCPGPIASKACYTDNGQKAELDHTAKQYDDNSNVGVWQQVFFSFVNNATQSFDHYTLDIENACTSTAGGDILIDDVEIFVSKPTVTVEKTSPVCGREVTLTKMSTSFDDLMLSLGLEENKKPASGNPKLWFCLLDKKLFDHMVDSLTMRNAIEGISSSEWQELFNACIVGDPNSSKEEDKAFRWVEVSTYYDQIEDFNYAKALATDKAIIQREKDAGGNRYIVISDKVNSERLLPRHDYYIVFVPRYGDDPITAANSAEQFQISSNCCIRNSFTTSAAVQILGDTEHTADGGNELEVCAGQNVNLTVQIKGTDKNTGDLTNIQTYYDWWLDFKGGAFENMYINADGTLTKNAKPEPTDASQISLNEALINMRHYYPNAISIEGLTPRHDADQPVELTQQMLDGLKAALTPESDGVPRLFLYRISLNVQIPSSYTEGEKSRIVTVVPIEFTNENIIYCFDPQHIVMSISGNAPRMLSGLAGTTYPNANFNAPVRTALDRTGLATELTAGTQPATLFRLPLHDIKGAGASATRLIPFELAATTPGAPAYTPVYLAGTNDPACQVYTTNAEGDMLMREVGRVVNLEARVKNQPDPYQPYADFYFLKDFTPREGYSYQLRFEYKEDPAEPAESGKPICNGAVCFDLKIVPQYLMWKAYAGNTDWNNDGNWKRADKDELYKTAGDTYPENNAVAADPQLLQTDNGFVPIEGCHVVIAPADYQPQLSGALNVLTATKDIQYDMVMKVTPVDNKLNCEAFYLNTCKDVLLQAGGELINAQHLKYNKAWMEYELAAGRWYTLGSPMQQMYAGDWFAPTQGGRQLTPYFEGITFNTTDYNRFSPAVYQRGWDKGTATLYYLSNLSNEASAANSQNVAVKAMWSSVYNDVWETYGNGGFSLKTLAASKSGTPYSNLLFRLPKEDTSYKYYKDNVTPGTGGNKQDIDNDKRNITYKLLTDKLSSATEFTQTITNNVKGNQYFLVGNPFPCGLDMTQFFNGNSTLIEQKYWLLTADGQASAMKTDAGWIAINTSGTPDVLAPGQGFFVKATGTSDSLTLTFTAEMMASARGYNAVLRAPARRSTAASCPTLRMRTETEAGSSEAVIVKLAEASNDYAAAEDMLTLLDDNLKDVPMVYSLADHQALTVNTRRTMQRVPVGITGGTDGPVQVVFSGLETFGESLSLLDDLTGVVTPLTLNAKPLPGVNELAATVDMQANVANRYFLLSSATPEAEEELTDVKPLVIVNGQKVNITTNAAYPLTYVHIVDAEGRTVYTLTPYTPTLSLKLPMGNYVVEARTATQAVTTKVNIAQ
ncbi:hypothetical protein MR642_09140 [bacterium]|nr:hypothetical protein [bacterium]